MSTIRSREIKPPFVVIVRITLQNSSKGSDQLLWKSTLLSKNLGFKSRITGERYTRVRFPLSALVACYFDEVGLSYRLQAGVELLLD